MRNKILRTTAVLAALFLFINVKSQNSNTYLHKSVIVNGGFFEFAPPYTDYVTITVHDHVENTSSIVDTIFTQSAQDIVMDTNSFYVAAADTIVRYDYDFNKITTAPFAGSSTIKILIYKDKLIVGNWYGATENNILVYDKNSLLLIDSIPEVAYGAKDFVIKGDTLYVQQNLTNSMFTDSAGFLSVIDLNKMQHVRDVQLNNNNYDLGRLLVYGDSIIGLNSISNTITTYLISTGNSSTQPANFDLQTNFYGQQYHRSGGELYLIAEGGVYTLDLKNYGLGNLPIIDSATAFAYDTANGAFVVTHTDFGSYSWGGEYNENGTLEDSISVGYAPECIGLIYGSFVGRKEIIQQAITPLPNPFVNTIDLKFEDDSPRTIQIWDMSGRKVFEKQVIGPNTTLNLIDLKPGVFILRSINGSHISQSKILKQ